MVRGNDWTGWPIAGIPEQSIQVAEATRRCKELIGEKLRVWNGEPNGAIQILQHQAEVFRLADLSEVMLAPGGAVEITSPEPLEGKVCDKVEGGIRVELRDDLHYSQLERASGGPVRLMIGEIRGAAGTALEKLQNASSEFRVAHLERGTGGHLGARLKPCS